MKLTIRSAILGGALSLLASAAFAQNTATATGTGAVNIITPIAVAQTTGIDFGTLAKPSTAQTPTLAASSSATTTGAPVIAGSASHAATFHVTGEAGYAFSITVDPTFTLTRSGGSETLTVTTSKSAASGTLTGGVADYYVGGSFPLATSTVVGAYSGNFNTTVTYN